MVSLTLFSIGYKFYSRFLSSKIFELDDWHELIENKKELFTDKTPWEEVDNFGNIYNRLVLFKSRLWHSYGNGFGDTLNNSMLYKKIIIQNG